MKALTRRAGGLTLTSSGTQFGNALISISTDPSAITKPNKTRRTFPRIGAKVFFFPSCSFIALQSVEKEGSPSLFPEAYDRGPRQSGCVLRRSGAYPSKQPRGTPGPGYRKRRKGP